VIRATKIGADLFNLNFSLNFYSESESPTRSLVINIVWFLLISFVVTVACIYSASLYKELSTFNYHRRLSLFAPNLFTISQKPDSEFLGRHIHIIKTTSKRLNIFIFLIFVFCFTFLPNFIMTLLKNIIDNKEISLKPWNLIGAIVNLLNPMFNSVVLLILCLYQNDSVLAKQLSFDNDDEQEIDPNERLNYMKRLFNPALKRNWFLNNKNNNVNKEEENSNIQMKELKPSDISNEIESVQNSNNLLNDILTDCNIKVFKLKNECQQDSQQEIESYNKSSLNKIEEFYSKVGNRLGTGSID
jgi:hypothetical protein